MFKRKEVVVTIQAQIFWLARQDPDTRRWLAVCPPLNLNAVGDTYEELQECGNEAMAMLFRDLVEEGEIEPFLKRNGWRMIGTPSRGHTRFDIPASWRPDARREELLHA